MFTSHATWVLVTKWYEHASKGCGLFEDVKNQSKSKSFLQSAVDVWSGLCFLSTFPGLIMSRELSSSSWILDVRRRHGSKKVFSSCVDDVWRFPNWFWDVLALARFSLTYYPLMFWDLNNWWDMSVLSMLCIIISWFFTAPMFTPLTSPKPIQNCHNFWVYIPIAISEKQIDSNKKTHPPDEGDAPRRSVPNKKGAYGSLGEATLESVDGKQYLGSWNSRQGERAIWDGFDGFSRGFRIRWEKNLGTCCSKNEEVSVFLGLLGKICLERNLP